MGVSMKVFEKNCIVRVFFMNEAKSCVIFEQEDFHRLKHKVIMAFEIKIFKYNYQTQVTESTKCRALFLGGENEKFLRMVRNAQKMISRMFFIIHSSYIRDFNVD